MNCPICLSDSYLWGIRQDYKVYTCYNCGHGYLELKQGDGVLVQSSYRGKKDAKVISYESEEYYNLMCNSEKPGKQTFITTQMAVKVIKKYCPNIDSLSLLEVGSCTGYLLQEVQKLGIDGIGIEPGSWGQIAVQQRGVKIVQGYLNETTFSKKFDIVVAMDVLEHTIDPLLFIKVLKSFMKPDGLLLLSFPNKESLQAKLLGVRWSMVMPIIHIHFFTFKSIAIALRKHQLKIVETYCFENTGIPYQFRRLRKIKAMVALSKFVLSQIKLGDQRFICAKNDPFL